MSVFDLQYTAVPLTSQPGNQLCWGCNICIGLSARNIAEGRRTAQERVTGGRWRRIVLVDVLAEHILELRGRARV